MKNYDVLNELVPKTQELHRAIFDKGYEQGQKDMLEQKQQQSKWDSAISIVDHSRYVHECHLCKCQYQYPHNYCPNCGARMVSE